MLKKKALEPLIASILLIVVAVILVTIVLSWGKEFSTKSVSTTNFLVNYGVLSDKQSFMRFVEAKNGMYTFDYYPPNTGDVNFKVVGYSLLGYNDYIPLEPEKEITHAGKFMLPLGIINEEPITISLLLEDGSYLTFKNIKNTNRAPAPSDCPTGFVPVPGNHLYGTVGNKGGFCVAQFEMKVDQNGDGIGDSNTSCKSSKDIYTWKNTGTNCAYNTGTRSLVSSAEGYPLTYINQTDSKLACESIGGHLITNEEWMTLARNIEIVPDNWSSGTVGQGSLKRGNTGYVVENVSYNGADPESGTGRNQLAMLRLTNGSEVWDLSGNVKDWTDKTHIVPALFFENIEEEDAHCILVEGEYSLFYSGDLETDNSDVHYMFPDCVPIIEEHSVIKYDQLSFNYKDLFLLNQDYNRDNGVGFIVFYFSDYWDAAFLRGGALNDETLAGVLFLNANYSPSSAGGLIGFRCVVAPE